MIRNARFVAVLAFLLTNHAIAQVVSTLEFDRDAVLPSASGYSYCWANNGTTESEVFSVENGLLQCRLFPTFDNPYYVLPDCSGNGAMLQPDLPLVIEVRMRLLQGNAPGAAVVLAFVGGYRYDLWLGPDAAYLFNYAGFILAIPLDVTVFHTYRIESPPDSPTLRLYVDGALVTTIIAEPVSPNANLFAFGGGTIVDPAATGDSDWDYVHLSQMYPVCTGDITGDSVIDAKDLLEVIAAWGTDTPGPDVTADSMVNVDDLIEVLVQWGPCATQLE